MFPVAFTLLVLLSLGLYAFVPEVMGQYPMIDNPNAYQYRRGYFNLYYYMQFNKSMCDLKLKFKLNACNVKVFNAWKINPTPQYISYTYSTCCAFGELTDCSQPLINKYCSMATRHDVARRVAMIITAANEECYPFLPNTYTCGIGYGTMLTAAALPLATFALCNLIPLGLYLYGLRKSSKTEVNPEMDANKLASAGLIMIASPESESSTTTV